MSLWCYVINDSCDIDFRQTPFRGSRRFSLVVCINLFVLTWDIPLSDLNGLYMNFAANISLRIDWRVAHTSQLGVFTVTRCKDLCLIRSSS